MKIKDGLLSDFGRVVAIALLALTSLVGCGSSGSSSGSGSSPATLVSVEVTPTNPSLPVGTSSQLTATAVWSNNQHTDVTSQATWSSSNAAVVTVNTGTGRIQGSAVGNATVTALYQGQSGTTTVTVSRAVLESIAVTPTPVTLALGTSTQLAAVGVFSDGSTADVSADVTWSSSATNVSSVNSSGLVQSLAVGTSTITATCSGSSCGAVSGSTMVTVTAAALTSIQVTPSQPSIALGLSQQFTATGIYSDGTHQDLTASVTWASDTLSVATVSNAAGTKGVASSQGVGTANITATSGSIVSASVPLSVTSATLVSIAITPAAPSVALGTTRQLAAIGTYTDNTTQDITGVVVWSSSAPGVATVSNATPFGLVTSLTQGTTTISAAMGSVQTSVTLTVTPAVLQSILVTPAQPTVALGLTQQFAATGLYSDGTHQDLTGSVTWASDTPGVATVSNAVGSKGLASSLAVGATNVTATSGSIVSNSAPLTVTIATLVSLSVSPSTPTIAAGTSQQFTATGTYTDNSTQDLTSTVTWSSSAPTVATISNARPAGLATSSVYGSTTITAVMGSVRASTILDVTTAVLQSIQVSASQTAITVGQNEQLAAVGTYTDGTTQDVTGSATWASDTSAVVSVSNASGSQGYLTALGAGSASITASVGSIVSPGVTFTVTTPQLVSLSITPSVAFSMLTGSTRQFTVTGTFSDGSSQDLTASSSISWYVSGYGLSIVDGLATAYGGGTNDVFAYSGSVQSNSVSVTVDEYEGDLFVLDPGLNTIDPYIINLDGTLPFAPTAPFSASATVYYGSIAANSTGQYLYLVEGNYISAYRNSGSGLASIGSPITDANSPCAAAVHPNGQYVYVTDTTTQQVTLYSVGSTGALTLINSAAGATDVGPCTMAISPNGSYLYVANTTSNTISQFTIGADGALTPVGNPANSGNTPVAIVVDPSGKYVYEANYGDNTIWQFTIGTGGALISMNPIGSVFGGDYPISIALNPNGKYLYVVAEADLMVREYPIQAATGALGAPTVSSILNGDPVGITVDPYGKYAYVVDADFGYVYTLSIASNGTLGAPSTPIQRGSGSAASFVIATPSQQ